jgi:preprotein translocase subunit SecA
VDELTESLSARAEEAFKLRIETLGDDMFRELENLVLLTTIDRHWRDHLLTMDEIKQGINLRSYGQKDPLIEYKKESAEAFAEMVASFRRETTKLLFRAQLRQTPLRHQVPVHAHKEVRIGQEVQKMLLPEVRMMLLFNNAPFVAP